jgi:HRDC domain
MKAIAAHAPMTVEELAEYQVIPEQKVKDYGDRIVKAITRHIKNEKLEDYVQNRPKKRPRSSSSGAAKKLAAAAKSIIDIEEDDEFDDDGIDYSAIDLNVPSNTTK